MLGNSRSTSNLRTAFRDLCARKPAACEHPDDPDFINFIREYVIEPPIDWRAPTRFKEDPAFEGNDGVPFMIDELLNYDTEGFFIEAGAYNGELRSNTFFLEHKKQFKGEQIQARCSLAKKHWLASFFLFTQCIFLWCYRPAH